MAPTSPGNLSKAANTAQRPYSRPPRKNNALKNAPDAPGTNHGYHFDWSDPLYSDCSVNVPS